MVPRAKCVINCNYCITQKGQKCNNRARVTLIAFCSLFTSKDCSAVGLYTLVKNWFCEFLPQLLAMCDPWVFLKREREKKEKKKAEGKGNNSAEIKARCENRLPAELCMHSLLVMIARIWCLIQWGVYECVGGVGGGGEFTPLPLYCGVKKKKREREREKVALVVYYTVVF